MTQLVEEKEAHLSNFTGFEKSAASDSPRWLDSMRKAAIERFDSVGFPNNKIEEWRFTNVAPIARVPFKLALPDEHGAAADAVHRFSFGADAACEMVFVNGHFSPLLSRLGKLPRGVHASSLADAIDSGNRHVESHLGRYADVESNPFVALNTGFIRDGAFVHFARGAVVEQPIHLLFVSTGGREPAVTHPRLLIVLEDGAIGTLVESYVGIQVAPNGPVVISPAVSLSNPSNGPYFTNAVTEIVAGQGVHLDHCKLQQEATDAYHVATMQVRLARDARFVSHSASIGSKLTRNDLNVTMAGEHADATLNGLVLIGGEQHVDNHTLLDHAAPNCPSHELYKHVLDGKSTAVFKGKILVRQSAQKTDSKQTSKSLLLSDEATMNSQPALEIYADDVKCTHGSTTGPVDEEQVFYMRSRGLSLRAARHLMTYAFAADITRRIKVEPVRRRLEEFMAAQHGLPQDLRITDLGSHDEAAVNL